MIDIGSEIEVRKGTASMLLSRNSFALTGMERLPGGGGGHSLIWPIRGRAAGQGMFFWPLCPEQGIQFYANLS